MSELMNKQWIAFAGFNCLAKGAPETVIEAVYQFNQQDSAAVLILDAHTSRVIDIDWRGSLAEVLERLTTTAPKLETRPVGRPKLGVVAKEVTLLPRHWDWLSQQAGGASVALRKLVEQASRTEDEKQAAKRQAQEACYRFMQALAGDLPAYEEALRALYANDLVKFQEQIAAWPEAIQTHALTLATQAIA